jgi:PAS domain S-box-containing protein
MSLKDKDSTKQAAEENYLDLKQRLEDLEQFKQRYELALSISASGLWDLDIITDQLYTSPRLKELLGYKPDEIEISMDDFWDWLHPEDLPSVQMALEKHLKEKVDYHLEYRLAAKSGEFLWFDAIGQAIWNDSGEAIRMAGSITDITLRKKSQEELEQIKELYELVLTGSEAGIWDYNIITDESYLSDRFKELLGYDPDEMENMSAEEAWSHLHPDYIEKAPLAMQNHLEKKTPYYSIDYLARTKSGEYRWFQARGKAIWDENGQAIRIAGSFIDINEQKIAEERIINNERLFRNILDQSPLAIELLSPEGKIERYNPAWMHLWGINKEEAEETITTYNKLTDPQIRDLGMMDQVKRAFAGEPVVLPPVKYSLAHAANDLGIDKALATGVPWIQCHLYPIKDESGAIVNVVNTYMNVTALREARDELQKEREMLAKIDRSNRMGQLTGSIAHELNQPLSGILNNAQAAQLYLNKEDHSELSEILTDIVKDSKRAGNVIQNLRELYQDQTIEFELFDLNSLVVGTINLLRSELVGNQIDPEVICEPESQDILGNQVQIQQVLVNLIMNAIEAMSDQDREQRKILVATKHENKMVQTWVEDSGKGMEEHLLTRIFEPFTSWKSGGTGMGLAISNSIIEVHGGRMWAENAKNGGLKVGFTIPFGK